jgi:hypothetical protein
MSKLMARLRQDFPKHEYLNTFEAAIPAYFVQLILEVLQKQDLTTFQRYILELLSLEVHSLEMMSYYLGVDQEVLTSSIVGLLKHQYVEQGDPQPGKEDRLLFLTGSGREAVLKQGPPPVPTRKTGRFFFNALTENVISPEEETLYPDQVDKQGLFVLPPKEADRPTLGTFVENEKDVKSVLENEPAFKDSAIVGMLKLKEISARYFAPVTVVVLQDRETHERTVAVYRNSSQQRPETEALQRLLEAKKFHIPAIGTPLLAQEQEINIPTKALPPDVVQEIRRVMENEHQREEIVIQVEEHQILKTATQDARERKELEEKIDELQKNLQSKEQAIETLRQQLRQSKVEFLRTEQHRRKLFQAVCEAKQEIIIISPWMTPTACDDQLCKAFAEAIVRGVRLRIGYGIGRDRSPQEAEYNRHNVEEVKKTIRKHVRSLNSSCSLDFLNDIVKTAGTHQKMLVCDRQFAITGSFNWLSYMGKQDDGYRQEISVLFQHPEPVNELAEIALKVWNGSKR